MRYLGPGSPIYGPNDIRVLSWCLKSKNMSANVSFLSKWLQMFCAERSFVKWEDRNGCLSRDPFRRAVVQRVPWKSPMKWLSSQTRVEASADYSSSTMWRQWNILLQAWASFSASSSSSFCRLPSSPPQAKTEAYEVLSLWGRNCLLTASPSWAQWPTSLLSKESLPCSPVMRRLEVPVARQRYPYAASLRDSFSLPLPT